MSMNAAIYMRVSSTRQAEEGFSLETQEQACRSYCERAGLEIIQVEKDAYTGASIERPGLIAVRQSIRDKVAGAVVLYDLDRLFRNMIAQALFIQVVRKARAELHVVTTGGKYNYSSPMGKLMLAIAAAFNEFRRDMIKESVVRGKRGRALGNERRPPKVCLQNVAPYGYHLVDGDLVVNEDEAEIVRRIYHDYIHAGRTGLSAVVQSLKGTPTPQESGHASPGLAKLHKSPPKTWNSNMIRRILTSPTYTGSWVYGRTKMDEEQMEDGGIKKIRLYTDKSEQVIVDVPPIVTKALQEQAIARMAENRGDRGWGGRSSVRDYLLSGFITCGLCGLNYSGMTVKHDNATYAYYRCGGRFREGEKCRNATIKAGLVEQDARMFVAAVYAYPYFIDGLTKREKERRANPADARLEKLDARLASIAAKRAQYVGALSVVGGGKSAKEIGARLAELDKDEAAVNKERHALKSAPKVREFSEAEIRELYEAMTSGVVQAANPSGAFDPIENLFMETHWQNTGTTAGEAIKKAIEITRGMMRDVGLKAVVDGERVDWSANIPGISSPVTTSTLAFWTRKRSRQVRGVPL